MLFGYQYQTAADTFEELHLLVSDIHMNNALAAAGPQEKTQYNISYVFQQVSPWYATSFFESGDHLIKDE